MKTQKALLVNEYLDVLADYGLSENEMSWFKSGMAFSVIINTKLANERSIVFKLAQGLFNLRGYFIKLFRKVKR